MNSWRKRAAAAAMILGCSLLFCGDLRAQVTPFSGMPGGGEPSPLGGLPQAPVPPGGPTPPAGPGGPAGAPGGPPPLTMTAGPNAWSGETTNPQNWWYISAGSVALSRQHLPHAGVAAVSIPVASDTLSVASGTFQVPVTFQEGNGQLVTTTVPVPVTYAAPTFTSESGVPFLSGAPTIGNYHDLSDPLAWGPSFALGIRADDGSAVEFSGYYLPQISSRQIIDSPRFVPSTNDIVILAFGPVPNPGGSVINIGSIPDAVAAQLPGTQVGRLNLPFTNAPAGFEGNNGLWLEADRVTLTFKSALGNGEANYYFASDNMFRPFIGFRYMDIQESLSLLTEDDPFTNPNPMTNATYTVRTFNRIATGQLGLEWNLPLVRWLSFSGTVKGAWGADFLTSQVSLTRGDGYVGFDTHRTTTSFSHIYEAGLFLDFNFLERARIHAGYTALFVARYSAAIDQFDYNLAQTSGHARDDGNAFYHGPVIEFQFLF